MLLKTLHLYNFRQYVDEKIEFSTDTEKNVTLFLGKNTSGKTTLVQAFRWVLYDDCNFTGKKSDQKNVINSDVRKQMRKGDTKDVKVSLTFIHQGITYETYRKYEYISKESGDAYLANRSSMTYFYDSNGEKIAVKGGDIKLKEILPESLSEYFFFDGEKIAESRKPENVKNSINTIMGLVPLEHMINHLENGRNNVEKTLRGLMKEDSGIGEINLKINNQKNELERAQESYKDAEKRYNTLENLVSSKAQELGRIQGYAEDASRLRVLDTKIKEIQKDSANTEIDLVSAFVPATAELIVNYVSKSILKNMVSLNYEDKGIPDMTAVAVNYLLSRRKCICGTDLSSNKNCRDELIELLSYLPPESIGTQIRHLNNDLSALQKEHSKRDLFERLDTAYSKQLATLDVMEYEQSIITDRIGDNRDADTVKEEYERLRSQRDGFNRDRIRYEATIQTIQKKIEDLNRQLSAAGKEDRFNKEILEKLRYVNALCAKAKESYESNSKEIFDDVKETLTNVFNNMYHGKRTIELTPDYKVTLNVGGDRLDNSKGLDTVQNFAFIASLLKVAKERTVLDLRSEAYPLVMDAVFSNTDEGHIKNICKELPKLSEQAIMALMDKDWSVASQTLEKNVGKKYRIEKISETQSRIVEAD